MAGNSRQRCYGNVQNPLELETPKPGVLLAKPRSRATSGSTEKCSGRFSALTDLQFGGPLSNTPGFETPLSVGVDRAFDGLTGEQYSLFFGPLTIHTHKITIQHPGLESPIVSLKIRD